MVHPPRFYLFSNYILPRYELWLNSFLHHYIDLIVLFACNNAYCINEKKAIKLLETFEYKPEKYAERVNHIFEVLGLSLFECYDMTEKLYKEVKKIATEINNFLNEGNSDERKQI
jgi:hypothetical protein